MSRYGVYRLAVDGRARACEEFSRVVGRLESVSDVRQLMTDLFSLSEIVMVMRRIDVADLLLRGAMYKDIRARTGASISLIAEVVYRLGKNGEGFRKAAERLTVVRRELDADIERAEAARTPGSYESFMRRTWMMHWPELVGRELPRIGRDVLAARKRKKSLAE